MTPGLVSVIIPTYNRADRIGDAIRSAQAQTWPDVEIIVADDGSTDRTADLIAEIPSVTYYRQEHRGQGSARNLGLMHARGEYVASLDSDDLWEPGFLKESVSLLEAAGADYAFSNWRESSAGHPISPSAWERSGLWKRYTRQKSVGSVDLTPRQSRELYVMYCPSPSSALLLRRSLVSKWSEEALIGDDWMLMLDLVFSRPSRGVFTMRPLWTKRSDGSNVYHGRSDLGTLEALEVHDGRLMARDLSGRMSLRERLLLRSRRADGRLNLSLLALRKYGRTGRAVRHLAVSLWLSPGPFFWFGSRWAWRRIATAVARVGSPWGPPAET